MFRKSIIIFILFPLFVNATEPAKKIKLSKITLTLDFHPTQPIGVADLIADKNKELIVIGENTQKQRIMAIFQLFASPQQADKKTKYQYHKLAQTVIPNHFISYDFLATATKDKLIFLGSEKLYEYQPEKISFKEIANINSIYKSTHPQYLYAKDFAKDLNNDLLGDILVQDLQQLNLLLQNSSGELISQSLKLKPKIDIKENSASFNEIPLFIADINLDNRVDLISVADNGLNVFYQNHLNQFSTSPEFVKLPFNVSFLEWWELKDASGQTLDQSNLSHRTIYSIDDINNDNIADLVVLLSQTQGVLDRQNIYEIYLGKIAQQASPQLIQFADEPHSTIKLEGSVSAFRILDIDNDNKKEIAAIALDIGIGDIISAILSSSVDQNIYLFKMDENDQFDSKPVVSKQASLKFSLSSGKSGNPVIKFNDFNGDGLAELMTSSGSKYLKIYPGTNSKRILKSRPQKFKIQIPKDGNYLQTEDVDQNGKQDIIIRYGMQDDKSLANEIVILLSK